MADTYRDGDGAGDDRTDPGGSADPAEGPPQASRPWRTTSDKPEKKGSLLRETIIIVACVLLISWLLQTFVGRQYVIPSESMETTLIGCSGCSNDRIFVEKLAYTFGEPAPGDVIVFKVPDSWGGDDWVSPRSSNPVVHHLQDALSWFGFAPPDENDYVKRIIAVGGQTIECRNSEGVGVKVNGKALKEPYVNMALQQQNVANGYVNSNSLTPDGKLNSCLGVDFGPITVPKGHVFVMGDNRTRSSDSRYHIQTDPAGVMTNDGTVPVDDIRGKTQFIIYPFSRMGGVGSVNPQQ
ncbi:signal peptidase I [Gordonia oryzae]|uniref:Signal peptidase I n=1 Tax=Gordonia oryzae TaxID=2487349 RepID=A0A3N4GGM0_9ACTN|nr:signal peptidase I [Gordonia oryzae]RPA58241.1 signal peptidase I [Gordonia oryzae]